MTSHALYASDLTIGHQFRTDGITVTESHVVQFAGLSGDFNPLHMNSAWAEQEGPHGERIAHGMLVLSLASGMRCMLDDLALIGFLGIENWRFRKPVLFGDTVHAEMTLSELRATSNPARSILRVHVEVADETDRCVQDGDWMMMILSGETSQ